MNPCIHFHVTGTLSVLYILLFVIIKSAGFGINVDFTDVTNTHFTPLFQITFPALSGMAALSFFIHNIIITIMRNNRDQENNVSTRHPATVVKCEKVWVTPQLRRKFMGHIYTVIQSPTTNHQEIVS
jgi:predicted membrane protein